MKALWQWFGTRNSYKVTSGLIFLYFFIAELGRTKSWWQAFMGLVLVWSIWSVGRGCEAAPEKND
jgi:hypothetical protein